MLLKIVEYEWEGSACLSQDQKVKLLDGNIWKNQDNPDHYNEKLKHFRILKIEDKRKKKHLLPVKLQWNVAVIVHAKI